MKACVWTSGPQPKRIWRGELSVIPPVGSLLTIREGWAAETVRSTSLELYTDGEPEMDIIVETEDHPGSYVTVP